MAKFGIGQAVRRVEDQRFLLGQGPLCRRHRAVRPCATASTCCRRTPTPRSSASTSAKAKAAPGVLLVLTGADAAADKVGTLTAHLMPEDFGAPKGHRTFQPRARSPTRVRYVGDRVAFVVAETLAQARDAADLVEVDYEPLPAVVNIWRTPPSPAAPKVWDDNPQGNNGFRLMFGNEGATDAAFAKAKHVVKLRVENNRLSPVSHGAARRHRRLQRGQRLLHALCGVARIRHGVRMELSQHLPRAGEPDPRGLARRRRRLWSEGRPFPDDLLVMWAASPKLRRPVKWVGDPVSESMLTDHHGREMVYYGELAPSTSTARSWRCESKSPVPDGRLLRRRGALPPARSRCASCPAAYDIQTLTSDVAGRCSPTRRRAGPIAARGRPEAAYFMERLIEHAARQIGMESAEIRRRNLDPAEQAALRHADALWIYDCGEFERLMDTVHRAAATAKGYRGAQEGVARRTASCAAAR